MQFQEINFKNKFDGIWASASLLHVPTDEIKDVLKSLKDALKENGILYASFKYGDFEGVRTEAISMIWMKKHLKNYFLNLILRL